MAEARAQKKLDLLMDQDATVAQLYQEAYKDAKAEGEREMDELKALHGRFDHYLDPARMAGTLPTRWYDPQALHDSENIQYSTDFTDLEEDLMYKRYKMAQYEAREDLKEYEATIDGLHGEQEAAEPVLEEVKRDKEGQVEAPAARRLTTMLYRARERTLEAQARDEFLENQIAAMKRGKALRQKEVTREKAMYTADPIFGDFMPDWSKDAESSRAQSLALHPEIRKMEYSTLPERPDASVYDEQSAREYEDFHKMTVGYYKGKLRFFEDCFNNQLALTTHGFETMREAVEVQDQWMSDKLDYMYDHLDYAHDRAKVRDKFLGEVNKRVTLEDIGETLDKMALDSKAAYAHTYQLEEHHNQQPRSATKDYSSADFTWAGRLLKHVDPKTPLFLEDPHQIDDEVEPVAEKLQQVYDRVHYEDAQRDYSYGALSPDEKTEIALFHSLKQDPYFKHHIHNHLRQYAEEEDEVNMHFPASSLQKLDVYDHAKFDKLNVFDFRRNLPMKERQARIDSRMRAYGYGKRKKSRALARVEPGTGKIFVNGKPLLQALFLPMQRARMLLPLILTHYTCLLDVNIRVWGGGYNGQVEAIVPALARAVQGFDVHTRKTLKHFGLTRNDPRNKERKKIGKQKARKGQVYRRR